MPRLRRTNKQRGRLTKLTPELQEKIVKAVSLGNYIETSAAYAGVNKQSLYTWMKRGNRQKKGPFRDFLDAIKKAMAEAEIRDLENIRVISTNGNWQASAWRLERKFPKKWGRKERIEHVGDGGGAVQVQVQVEVTEVLVTNREEVKRFLAVLPGSNGVPLQ